MIGQTLNNRYKIASRLGKGAMGTVYRATDTKTDQEVAIKVIASDLAVDPVMLERFRREGETLRQLRHLNIVGYIDAFQHEEQYVIVMEYVTGGSLYELLKAGSLPIDRATQITLDLCDALIRSHRLKIIHRDIKPENVLIAEDGTPKLADFGVARLSEGTRMTRSGMQVGTPYYMAPEAWEGKTLDGQADIWSLGVLMFEMLAGKLPFTGDTPLSVMAKVNTTPPPDLRKLRADAPTSLVKIISRMLTRNKMRRYQTMREVAVDLERSQQEIQHKEHSPKKPVRPAWSFDGLNRISSLWVSVRSTLTNIAGLVSGRSKTIVSSKRIKVSPYTITALILIIVVSLSVFLFVTGSGGSETYYTTNGPNGIEIRHSRIQGDTSILRSTGGEEEWHPAPDRWGNLYFSSGSPGGQVEIFVLDRNGIKSQVTHSPEPYSSWDPYPDDLGNLYFSSDQVDGLTEIYVIKSDGKKSRVTNSSGEYENWSPAPDGLGNLYFVSNKDGKAEIYVIDAKGNKSQVTHTKGDFESWSPAPDGSGNLYFVSNQDGNSEIYVIDKRGRKLRATNSPPGVENWSPVPAGSGNLFFTSTRNGVVEIFRMNSKGITQILKDIPSGSWLINQLGDPTTPESVR